MALFKEFSFNCLNAYQIAGTNNQNNNDNNNNNHESIRAFRLM